MMVTCTVVRAFIGTTIGHVTNSKGIYRIKDISAVTGISETLVKQYRELITESKKDKTRKENLKLLIERSGYREGIKKMRQFFQAS